MFEDSVYCVLRRTNVHIAWTQLPLHDAQEVLPDSPVPVCLHFGEACPAGRCPTFQVPRQVMASWVARAGLGHGRLRERRGHCPLCGELADLQGIDASTQYCPQCAGFSVAARDDQAGGHDGATEPRS